MGASRRQTNETLRNDMWRACDTLCVRRDNNVGGVMQYTEHLAWLLFLKFLDEEEKKRAAERVFSDESYEPVLRGDLAWDYWASPEALKKWDVNALIQYVRGRLLPGLATLSGVPLAQTISRIFSDESVLAHNPVAQDAAYVALSARLGAPLVTAPTMGWRTHWPAHPSMSAGWARNSSRA